ncbi:hypothetical protein CFP59_03721 [Streptomyces malaysiensis subsp. malaysiensis]|nr:hypothetical protein CFP59_03721 [Streptomyces sp. M56]
MTMLGRAAITKPATDRTQLTAPDPVASILPTQPQPPVSRTASFQDLGAGGSWVVREI